MAQSTILFLALTILAAQCVVLKEAPKHPREKRSPHDPCDDDDWHHHGPPPPPGPPGPPGPPPLFASRNWSGYSKGPHGFPQGVFSGAAASANLGAPAVGQAFSVASSSAGNDGAAGSGGFGSQNGGFGGQKDSSLASANSNSGNNAGTAGGSGGQQFGTGFGASHGRGYSSGQSGSYKDSQSQGFGEQQQTQNDFGGFKDHNTGYGKASANSAGYSQQSNAAGYGQNSQFGSYKHSHHTHDGLSNQGFDGQQQIQGNLGTGFKDNGGQASSNSDAYSQQSNSAGQNFGHGSNGKYNDVEQLQGNEQQQQSSDSRGQWQQGGYGSNSASSSQSGSQGSLGHGALSGALNLASQGLQTSQGLQPGCTTCSKGYALSNAKSKSGDAVAVSIGG